MALVVRLPAELVPAVGRLVDDRRRHGLDVQDEWHDGVYVVVPPHERPQAKLGFYAAQGVRAYVEVGPDARTARLWRNVDGSWHEPARSEVLDFDCSTVAGEIDWRDL